MNILNRYTRQRELYNQAFGRFISVHKFDVEAWLTPDNLTEYNKLKGETHE